MNSLVPLFKGDAVGRGIKRLGMQGDVCTATSIRGTFQSGYQNIPLIPSGSSTNPNRR